MEENDEINKYKPFQKKHTSLKISPMFQKKEKEPEVIEEVAEEIVEPVEEVVVKDAPKKKKKSTRTSPLSTPLLNSSRTFATFNG